ncbi:MAG: AAA family ATPase [Candidatus Thiodiazotropha lotti]|nr:AAA family ATPase [Candidatus Thiodiazotropha lotti]
MSNFRRLSDVSIDLDEDISIFVGANNSGKTSVAQAMHLFLAGVRDRISFHDISACRWADIEAFANGEESAALPEIAIDLWFAVQEDDLHRVIDVLPSLDWQGTHVGIRITFAPQNQDQTRERFLARHADAQRQAADVPVREGEEPYIAPPTTLREFLEAELRREYEFRYYVLDVAQFNERFEPNEGYKPQELLREQGRTGKDIINSLIKVDFLHAQRHLSDTAGGSRAEELSRHLSRYYQRNLERHSEDYNAIRALAVSENLLNQHLEQVFAETLRRLAQLGYPGFTNPRILIRSALNPATVMNSQDGAQVHYALHDEDNGFMLPDKNNGLGFKNLIYMVVELLDLHAQWLAIEDDRPPLHLVFVEEPEAHLHTQLQQVFVNKVLDILREEADDPAAFQTQLVLTTHSPHILFERGFRPIRYFRRENAGVAQSSQVLNLSEFYDSTADPSRDFLERYLKLTHCDLFFADAAVLVEGNVERLVMRQMIRKEAPGLRSSYLSVLEIGGAFGHKFRTLIEFLGITTLIITDLDSVHFPVVEHDEADDDDEDEEVDAADPTGEQNAGEDNGVRRKKKTCTPETADAVTSNQMLVQWLPARQRIDELLALKAEDKELEEDANGLGAVRVTYPCTVKLNWNGEVIGRAGRTLEAAFAFENLEWAQQNDNRDLNLRVRGPTDVADLALRLHNKIHKDSFKKTDFALALLSKDPESWTVPHYISEGLQWLERRLGVAEQNNDGDQNGENDDHQDEGV